jgi:hypothetical protein
MHETCGIPIFPWDDDEEPKGKSEDLTKQGLTMKEPLGGRSKIYGAEYSTETPEDFERGCN